MTIKESINIYLDYKKTHLKDTSVKTMKIRLVKFSKWIGKEADISELKFNNIINYFSYLKEKGLHVNSQTQEIYAIKGFLKFMVSMKYIDFPIEMIKRPKGKETKHRVCTKTMFDIVDNFFEKKDFEKIEKHIAFRMLWVTGMRVHELLKIKICEIDFEKRSSILEVGKSGSSYIILWDEKTNNLIKDLINHPEFDNREYLFNCDTKKIQRWFEKISREAGAGKITPHAMRHGRAHYMLDNGARLIDVKNYLRHKTILSTQMYARQNKKERYSTLLDYCFV